MQAQPAFLRRRVVHQLLHLRQLRAHPVQVALPGLAQHRVADVAGVERRVPQKAVVVFGVQIQFAQQVGRAQHLRRVGQRRAALHRHRGARRLPQQAAQVAEQAVVHLPEPAQRRVAAYQVTAVAGGIGDEQPVLAGRQRVVGERRAGHRCQPLTQRRLQVARGARARSDRRGRPQPGIDTRRGQRAAGGGGIAGDDAGSGAQALRLAGQRHAIPRARQGTAADGRGRAAAQSAVSLCPHRSRRIHARQRRRRQRRHKAAAAGLQVGVADILRETGGD